jgi:hypothetical protein
MHISGIKCLINHFVFDAISVVVVVVVFVDDAVGYKRDSRKYIVHHSTFFNSVLVCSNEKF